MSWIALDIDFAAKYLVQELRIFLDQNVLGYTFCPPERYQPRKPTFWGTSNWHGIVWNSGKLEYSELQNVFPKDVEAKYFASGTEKIKNKNNSKDEIVRNLDYTGCHRNQDLAESTKELWIRSSVIFRHKTLL